MNKLKLLLNNAGLYDNDVINIILEYKLELEKYNIIIKSKNIKKYKNMINSEFILFGYSNRIFFSMDIKNEIIKLFLSFYKIEITNKKKAIYIIDYYVYNNIIKDYILSKCIFYYYLYQKKKNISKIVHKLFNNFYENDEIKLYILFNKIEICFNKNNIKWEKNYCKYL